MKRKLVTLAMALVMVLAVGCKVELNSDGFSFGSSTQEMEAGDIVMPDGKILLSDFDVITIREFLVATTEVKDYHIILNTGGGNAFNCVTMINRLQWLQSQGAHITTEIIGYGMSAGTLIFLMGDTRIVHEGALLMFHGAGLTQGYSRLDAKKACENPAEGKEFICDFLTMLDQNFKNIMKEKTTMSDKQIEDWLYSQDFNFMSAVEAFQLNVATKLIGDE